MLSKIINFKVFFFFFFVSDQHERREGCLMCSVCSSPSYLFEASKIKKNSLGPIGVVLERL